MKKYILSFALLGVCFIWSCRSKEVDIISQAVVQNPSNFNPNDFLKTVSVTGAIDVKIDHDLEIIQVTLPESYSSKFISFNFTLVKGAFLDCEGYRINNRTTAVTFHAIDSGMFEFNFQGAKPLVVSVALLDKGAKYYTVYVNQINKKLLTEISKIDSISYNSQVNFYLTPVFFKGTIPSIPNEKPPYALLKKVGEINADTVRLLKFVDGDFTGTLDVNKFYPIGKQLFSIEFVENGVKQLLSDKLTFYYSKTKASFVANSSGMMIPTISVYNQKLELFGGIFRESNKYTLKFHNDYSKEVYQLNAQIKDSNNLIAELPSQIPTGGYLVDIFENGDFISRDVVNVGKNKIDAAIRAIFNGADNTIGNLPSYTTKKTSITAGDSLLILPVEVVFFGNSRSITPEELESKIAPKLQLKTSSKEIILNPKRKVFGWAFAGVSVLHFQYIIPKSTESGFYEAQLIYPDGRESLKYWNKIEIR